MSKNEELYLGKGRRVNHYMICFFCFFLSLMPVFFIIKSLFNENYEAIIPMLLIFLILLSISSLFYLSQRKKLKFTKLETNLSQNENLLITKVSIQKLGWILKEESQNFIEAYNPHRDFRTWGDEMISILILDTELFVNSICNLEKTYNQAFFSFGKNKQNIEKFISMFNATENEYKGG